MMKVTLTAVCFLVLMTISTGFAKDIENPAAFPVAVASTDRYEFQTVPEGTIIKHDFIIQNKGNGPLVIESVEQTCSCITIVSYDKTIAPEDRGVISIQLDTNGYGGKNVVRDIRVVTNSSGSTTFKLTLAGKVDQLYTLLPRVAKLNGSVGEQVQTEMKLFPEDKYRFKIIGSRAQKGTFLSYSIKEILEDGKRGYVLNITSTKKEKGLFFDKIFLTTDNKVAPEIVIGVFGKIAE